MNFDLESFLDNCEGGIISENIYNDCEKFGYINKELFKTHLDFMLTNLYDIKVVKEQRRRLNQIEFRQCLLEKFNNSCIITGQTCTDELTAAHIVPISENENYDIDNGLLLIETIHRTYDKFKWSINPETLCIEVKQDDDVGTIQNYENKKINLQLNNELKQNLICHYNKFKKIEM
jgi:hypothetical protein